MKNKTVYEVLKSNGRIDNIGIFLQIIIVIFLAITLVITLFIKKAEVIMYLLLGLTFIIMAYNNHNIFKRKTFTIIYLVMGILFMILTGMMLIGK